MNLLLVNQGEVVVFAVEVLVEVDGDCVEATVVTVGLDIVDLSTSCFVVPIKKLNIIIEFEENYTVLFYYSSHLVWHIITLALPK